MFMSTLLLIGTLFLALFVGVLFAAGLAISPSLNKLDATNYTVVKQAQIKILQIAMSGISTVYMILALVGAFQVRGEGLNTVANLTFWGVGLIALALAYSGFTDIPYNQAILKWEAKNPPKDWAKMRDAWDLANYVRTVPAVLALVLQLVALTLFGK